MGEFLEKFQKWGGHFQSKNSYFRFWTIKQCFKQVLFGKNCNIIFRKLERGGFRGYLELFRIHLLVASPVPKMAERNHLVKVDGDDHGSEFDHEWRLSHLELV